jgi:CBS domain-containing protein
MNVEQIMTRSVRVCTRSDALSEAARLMWEHDCGAVPVVEAPGSARVVGMITDRDVCMAAYTQGRPLHEIPVGSACGDHVVTCAPSDSVDVALRILRAHQLHRLPVVGEDGGMVGMLSLCDVAREAAREEGPWKKAVSSSDVGRVVEAIRAPRETRAMAASAA